MCATKTSAITVPSAARGERSAFAMAMIAIVAFQEALAMRRAAQKTYLLHDE
jgi:hypothetical protein